MRPNYQRIRSGAGAALLRRGLYRLVVWDGEWPPRFKRPSGSAEARLAPSAELYVHLPFCRSICPHCPYNKCRIGPGAVADYASALEKEIAAYLADGAPPARSLYFGGGTPSLTPDLVERAIGALAPLLGPETEVAMEVHPADARMGLFGRMRAAGVGRVSLGIETLDPRLLRRLGRAYTRDRALAAVDAARDAGFGMVDVNLIFGIPGQSVARAVADLDAVLARGVDQISAYPLFTFAHTPAGVPDLEDRYARAAEGARLATHRAISARCRAAGLARTSVWSFTRPGVPPYTTVTRPDYRGFGAGAGSRGAGRLAFNTFSVPAYVEAPVAGPAFVLTMGERQRRADWLYWRIYCAEIDPAEYALAFGARLSDDFGALLAVLRVGGFLRRKDGRFRLTERGAIWVHRVQSLFSLSAIDAVWTRAMAEAWPAEIVLP